MKRLRILVVILIFITIITVATGCAALLPREEALPEPMMTFTVTRPPERVIATVVRGNIELYESLVALSVPARSETLRFSESGLTITGVYVDIGDTVSVGDVIASSGDELIEAETERLLEIEAATLNRLGELTARHQNALRIAGATGVPLDDTHYLHELQVILNELDSIRYDLNLIHAEYESHVLRAGIDGIVTMANRQAEGQLTDVQAPIAVINDRTHMVFLLQRKPDEVFGAPGDRIEMEVGRSIIWVEVIDPEEHGIDIEGFFDGGARMLFDGGDSIVLSPDYQDEITPGLHGRVRTPVTSVLNTIKIPTVSLHSVDGREFVFVIENGVRRIRYVETGLSDGTYTEITGGLVEGEEVVRR